MQKNVVCRDRPWHAYKTINVFKNHGSKNSYLCSIFLKLSIKNLRPKCMCKCTFISLSGLTTFCLLLLQNQVNTFLLHSYMLSFFKFSICDLLAFITLISLPYSWIIFKDLNILSKSWYPHAHFSITNLRWLNLWKSI